MTTRQARENLSRIQEAIGKAREEVLKFHDGSGAQALGSYGHTRDAFREQIPGDASAALKILAYALQERELREAAASKRRFEESVAPTRPAPKPPEPSARQCMRCRTWLNPTETECPQCSAPARDGMRQAMDREGRTVWIPVEESAS